MMSLAGLTPKAAFSTYCFMYVHGPEGEIHPMVYFLSLYLGVFIGPFIGGAFKVLSGMLAMIYIGKYERLIMYTASTIYTYAFFHNIIVSGLLEPYST